MLINRRFNGKMGLPRHPFGVKGEAHNSKKLFTFIYMGLKFNGTVK